MRVKYRKKWSNTIKKYQSVPLKWFEPECLSDIQQIILEAQEKKVKVRAIGSGHSFSNVALTHDYLVDLKCLKKISSPKKTWIKQDKYNEELVQVEGGITIQEFNKEMARRNLCVLNMGGIDNQTLAGAISTGTHGTGIGIPAFQGMVRSFIIACDYGKTYRVEPKDGLMHPETYYEEGIELIQDDDVFNSMVVGLGCMGVVYSYILQMEKMFWMAETKTLTTWEDVRPKLKSGELFEKNQSGQQLYRGIMVQLNPYRNKQGKHTCIVVRHMYLAQKPHRTIPDAFRNIISSIFGSIPISYWFVRFLIKFLPRRIPRLLDGSLRSLKDKRYENKGYKVMYQGVEFVKIRAYDCEFAFDVGANTYTNMLDGLIGLTEKFAKDDKQYQTSPIGLRFVKGSYGYMSPDYNKTVVYIDTPFVIGSIGADGILEHYQEYMLAHGGTPHWGKIHTKLIGNPQKLMTRYPQLKNWITVYKRFNAQGTFDNAFSDNFQFRSLKV